MKSKGLPPRPKPELPKPRPPNILFPSGVKLPRDIVGLKPDNRRGVLLRMRAGGVRSSSGSSVSVSSLSSSTGSDSQLILLERCVGV